MITVDRSGMPTGIASMRIAALSLSDLLTAIDSGRHHGNLSSAIRLFVLNFYREQFLDRLDVRDKREAIQGLIGSATKSSKTPLSG
jgi:predicted DNA-binding ribbon-helix-helix protein